MKRLRYYWFCIRWLYRNREWNNTRQKYKAMDREYRMSLAGEEDNP
jgi:hypothetical protein